MSTEPARSELDKKVVADHPVKVSDPLNLGDPSTKIKKDRTKMAGYHDQDDKKAYEKLQPDPGPMKYRDFKKAAQQVARQDDSGNDIEYQEFQYDQADHPLFEAQIAADMIIALGGQAEVNEEALSEGMRPHRVRVHVFAPDNQNTGRTAQDRTLRLMAKDPEHAVECANAFYKHNGFKEIKLVQSVAEDTGAIDQLVEAKYRDASPEDVKKFYRASTPLRHAVQKNMDTDGKIKDFGVHHDLVNKHADLMRRHGLLVHKGKLRKISEELDLDESKRIFPHMTARLRSQKNDNVARADWEANGKDLTLKAERHIRAADRYARLASGKKAFREDVEGLEDPLNEEHHASKAASHLEKANKYPGTSSHYHHHMSQHFFHKLVSLENSGKHAEAEEAGRSSDFHHERAHELVRREKAATSHSGVHASAAAYYAEETEQLDELSKDTLKSYVKKAVDDVGTLGRYSAQAATSANRNYYNDVSRRRKKGVDKAVDKLTKEEVEELDEISKKTLGSYLTKSIQSAQHHRDAARNSAELAKSSADGSDAKKFFGHLSAQHSGKEFSRVTGQHRVAKRLQKEELDESFSTDHSFETHYETHKDNAPHHYEMAEQHRYKVHEHEGQSEYHMDEGKKYKAGSTNQVHHAAMSDYHTRMASHHRLQSRRHMDHYEHLGRMKGE